jgi:hypothetical protein
VSAYAYKRAVLERFLNETEAKIAAARARMTAKAIAGALNMPGLGGKSFGEELRLTLETAKKSIEELKANAAGAVIELVNEINAGGEGVKLIRDDAAGIKAAFAGIVGNGPPAGAAATTANSTTGSGAPGTATHQVVGGGASVGVEAKKPG